MRLQHKKPSGFTLLEMVVVLALVSLGLVFGSMLLVTTTGNYVSAKGAIEDGQKIQVAMNRLVKELTFARQGNLEFEDDHSVKWTSDHPHRFNEIITATRKRPHHQWQTSPRRR